MKIIQTCTTLEVTQRELDIIQQFCEVLYDVYTQSADYDLDLERVLADIGKDGMIKIDNYLNFDICG